MVKLELDHPIFNSLDKEALGRAYDAINKFKIGKSLPTYYKLKEEDLDMIKKVLIVLEFSIIDLWPNSINKEQNKNDQLRIKNQKMFNNMCLEYFKFSQILPIPKEPIPKIKHTLKLITFSYLGEKWEDMKRFLIENEESLIVEIKEARNWEEKIYFQIYMSIFYLIRKKSWKDLEQSKKYINSLRSEQEKFEKEYLDSVEKQGQVAAVLELAALYHLAKSTELISEYMNNGTPRDVTEQLNFHFNKAIYFAQNAKLIDFDIILIMLQGTFQKMVFNSIWSIANTVNSRVTKFANIITRSDSPIFELLYPQKVAIVEQGLLDPANKAIVVNLPTSSGKTLIAEFRILQALNQFADEKGWIAYIVPTKSLVNQITSRLRRDLDINPLNIKIEKMSGALEIDSFEENIISPKNSFGILVTTPEKMSLLIRQGLEKKLGRPLVLVIIDEAQNLSQSTRGLNLELLLSTINKDCTRANLLLLTPFIPNVQQVAAWLSPQNPKSISIGLDWKPNERVIGMFYPDIKSKKEFDIIFKPLLTSQDTIKVDEEIKINKTPISIDSYPKFESKYVLTSLMGKELFNNGNILLITRTIPENWDTAEMLYNELPELSEITEEIVLIKKYIAAELGKDFPLIKYLDKGIGIHNAGLPEDIRFLIEGLMEQGSLKVLIATTTIAQGINFEVSTLLVSSNSYPFQKMPMKDFWNLVGRVGRMYHKSIGFVGIATHEKGSEDMENITSYVQQNTEELVSYLVTMVEEITKLNKNLKLVNLAQDPAWCTFLQYISHMYKQSEDLKNFLGEVELTLTRTYGFSTLNPENKAILLNAVKEYAENLDKNKDLATLSDMTGFSPETITLALKEIKMLGIKQSDMSTSKIFTDNKDILQKIMGIMMLMPEVKEGFDVKLQGTMLPKSSLARIISDWVSGKEIKDISKEYFGNGPGYKPVSDCVTALYQKMTNAATWGFSAIQLLQIGSKGYDSLNTEEKIQIKNLPAMIYYGVNSNEAILMRMNNVPRSISNKLGNYYKSQKADIYNANSQEVIKWLKDLPDTSWQNSIPTNASMNGKEYKQIWKKLSGINESPS